MIKKNSKIWMSILLVFTLMIGLAYPVTNVNAASNSKKKEKKCW